VDALEASLAQASHLRAMFIGIVGEKDFTQISEPYENTEPLKAARESRN